VNANGKQHAVRWAMQPTVSVAATDLHGDDALQQEITARVAAKPVVFDWVFTLAEPMDDENNPTKAWPDSRQQISAGQIVLTGTTAQLEGDCHAINFDRRSYFTGALCSLCRVLSSPGKRTITWRISGQQQ